MKQSALFTRTIKDAPKDEVSFNAQILIRAGFIDKLGAGIYTFLPLGLRVMNKITNIIREEMNNIGSQEMLMPALIPRDLLDKTGRWDLIDVLFKLDGVDKKEYALGSTHEEVVTPTIKKHVISHKELPLSVYQIQNKFRNELRAKSGLMRGREFLMKDLYSFHKTQEDLDKYYEIVQRAYFKVYERCSLLDITYLTYASGGDFSKYSHEFQALTEAGEDDIYICNKCNVAINKEIIEEQSVCPVCGNKKLEVKRAVEVGNIFKLGTRFTDSFDFNYIDKEGKGQGVIMGCYGIGVGRLMGTIAEVRHDDNGVIWPEEVAPFKVHLLALQTKNEELNKWAESVYDNLISHGIEVLYDDRDVPAGQKFTEADLIGCPFRLVIGAKNLNKRMVEVKRRDRDEVDLVSENELINKVI